MIYLSYMVTYIYMIYLSYMVTYYLHDLPLIYCHLPSTWYTLLIYGKLPLVIYPYIVMLCDHFPSTLHTHLIYSWHIANIYTSKISEIVEAEILLIYQMLLPPFFLFCGYMTNKKTVLYRQYRPHTLYKVLIVYISRGQLHNSPQQCGQNKLCQLTPLFEVGY